MVQTRSQAKSSNVKMPEVHGAKKDLIQHVKPKKSVVVPSAYPIPPTCHLRLIHHTPHTDQSPPINVVPPVPKPRIGLGRTELEENQR